MLFDEINNVIKLGSSLLKQEVISLSEIDDYKIRGKVIFQKIHNKNYSDLISDLANDGLKIQVRVIKDPILRWFYLYFIGSKKSKIYNAPFMEGSTENDYRKQYIFYVKIKLEAILLHLSNLKSNK